MRKVTLRYIAEKTGVRPSTVSRALDPAKASLVHPGTRELVGRLVEGHVAGEEFAQQAAERVDV